MKLFAIYIGGEHPAANIEVHDVRFIVAESIKATHETLRAEWWGTPGTLHVDCYAEISHADGYIVTLRPEPSTAREKLWFVNLGGYDGKGFAEQHKNMFVVASSMKEAKDRALATLSGWKDSHRDDIYEAEQAFALDRAVGDGLHIHLTPGAAAGQPPFTCRYTPLK
ncbi:DUF1543 domain-containing protein [Sphingomonas sp. HF-S3]|uniref:DUF1543 domain-containing protein n=1 Tax=Sphingomonas rustica TaxID=3103142 RepID=A0ABV0B9X5_9SPHN